MIDGKISRSLADKMYSAVFNFDKTDVGGILSSIFLTKLVVKLPDYTGSKFNTVFVGIAPSGDTNYTYAGNLVTPTGDQQIKAFDYSYYLTAQYVEPENLVLLKWADQQTDLTYRLQLKSIYGFFVPGDRVLGATSGDSGTVVAIGYAGVYYADMKAMVGSVPYFQDSEQLWVGGIVYSLADGAAYNVSGTITRKYPEDYITALLGGAGGTKWAELTGIYPYYFKSSGSIWGVTIPEIEFAFTTATTKADAIEKICKYMKWIFYVRWRDIVGTGNDIPCAYFLPESELDNVEGQPLPAPVYVTATVDYNAADARKHLVSPFVLVQDGANQYNWVIVRCQGLSGAWYQSINGSYGYGSVYDPTYNPTGTEPKRVYYEENKDISTQADCTARATDLYLYYSKQVCTWKATFLLRSDFVLLQKLLISGYSSSIPDGTYRIIGIEYNYAEGGTRNEVQVSIILDSDFKAYLNLKRVYLNSVFEVQNIVQDALNNSLVNLTGTVISRSGNIVLVAIDGQYGAVKRSAFDPTGALAAGNKVVVTIDSVSGKVIATKAS